MLEPWGSTSSPRNPRAPPVHFGTRVIRIFYNAYVVKIFREVNIKQYGLIPDPNYALRRFQNFLMINLIFFFIHYRSTNQLMHPQPWVPGIENRQYCMYETIRFGMVLVTNTKIVRVLGAFVGYYLKSCFVDLKLIKTSDL